MTEPAWLSWRTALEIHNLFLARHGGMPGVRDQGVLEASAGRARFKWAYESVGIAQCAASYAYAFATAHAFNDGNKRTAFYSALAFLVLNERTLADVDAEEARDLILDTAMGRTGEDELHIGTLGMSSACRNRPNSLSAVTLSMTRNRREGVPQRRGGFT